jgi:hypothetical protein
MCQQCKLTGCQHDWQEWEPEQYKAGYEAFRKGEILPPPPGAIPPRSYLGFSMGYMVAKDETEDDNRK